ncbi:MAG: competence/damage-inducible protein A [Actinomycetota bacterium]|nr:competence/damage-inducible protein A [Actinomycetota bacterium]
MIVETLAIGTELLLGQIVNTNASEIAARLADVGMTHLRQSVIGDNQERMEESIAAAVARSEVLIITGGIGPTQDDVTRESVAKVAGVPLVFDQEYATSMRSRWIERGRDFPESNLKQANRPEGAIVVPNHKGSAPGFRMEIDGCWVICLPGVPTEMLTMLDEVVIPFLASLSGHDVGVVTSRMLRSWGMPESRVGELLDDLFRESENPTVAFLASGGEIKIRLTAAAPTEELALALIAPLEAEVRERMGDRIFGADDDVIEKVIHERLLARGWTIGSAESATGGLIARRLTHIGGTSATFRGSIVAYAQDLKETILGVDPKIIDQYGVVSEETAAAMATGARGVLGVDIAVAVTGSAGPEPMEQPVGTMIVAVSTPTDDFVKTFVMPGDRERIRAYTATAALHMVRTALDQP